MAWTPALICLIWSLVRAFGIAGDYLLVPILAYTPYVIPVAVVAAVVAACLREWLAAAAALLAAFIVLLAVAPRLIGGEYELGGTDSVRVMSANVFKGSVDADQLLRLARERDVDVLALQELTPKFARRLEEAGIDEELPHSALAARPGVSGSGIYARGPVAAIGAGELLFKQMRAEVKVRGHRLDVTSVHPRPPTGWAEVDLWRAGLDELPSPDRAPAVQVLAGDFNGTLDNPELRELVNAGYEDVAEQVGLGLVPTWPALDRNVAFLPVAIDHLMIEGDALEVGKFEVLDIDGTDHRPLYAELVVPASS